LALVGREGVDHRREDRHRVAIGREPLEVLEHALVEAAVIGEQLREALAVLDRGQAAEDDQPRGLDERGLAGDLLDRNAAVTQDAGVAVDEGDGRLARAGVAVAVIEGDVAGLGRAGC
jgi:hypothetical protein